MLNSQGWKNLYTNGFHAKPSDEGVIITKVIARAENEFSKVELIRNYSTKFESFEIYTTSKLTGRGHGIFRNSSRRAYSMFDFYKSLAGI